MKVKWLFEKDVFEDNTDKLIEIVRKQGMEAKVVPYIPFDDELVYRCNQLWQHPDPDGSDCVIFYGSLNFGKKLQKSAWVPGVYLNQKAFECTSYYPVIKDLLIHYNDFIMLPYGSLEDKRDYLFNHFQTGKLFIRPNSGTKEFTGFVTTRDKFSEAVKLAGFYDVEPELLVLVSGAWDLQKEWRFVVVDGKVISGSLYRSWGGSVDDPSSQDFVLKYSKSLCELSTDEDAWDVAQQCADRYNPDRAWTIDVCQTLAGQYKILEIGCFSCAGMYGNDLDTIVEKVSESALNEWKEIYE